MQTKIFSTIIAIIKVFGEDTPALKPLCWLCDLYITVIRGIPVVVLLLITFFIIFASSDNGSSATSATSISPVNFCMNIATE